MMNLNIDSKRFEPYVIEGEYNFKFLKKTPKDFTKFFLFVSTNTSGSPLKNYISNLAFKKILNLYSNNKIKPSMFLRAVCVMPEWINKHFDELKDLIIGFDKRFLTTPSNRFHENAVNAFEIFRKYPHLIAFLKEAKIICKGGEEITCPQIFLAANSELFKTSLNLFGGTIQLKNYQKNFVAALLFYCCTNEIPDNYLTLDLILELLEAAENFQIRNLKNLCLSILENNRDHKDWKISEEFAESLYNHACNSEHSELALRCLKILSTTSPGISGFRYYGTKKLEIGIRKKSYIDKSLFDFLRPRTQSLVFTSKKAIKSFIELCDTEKQWEDIEKLDFANIEKELNGDLLRRLYQLCPNVKIINCSHSHFNNLQHKKLKKLKTILTNGVEENFSPKCFEYFDYLVALRFCKKSDEITYSIINCKNRQSFVANLKDADDTLLQVLASHKKEDLEISSKKITLDGVKNYLIHKPKEYTTVTFSDSPAICDVLFVESEKYFPQLSSLKKLQFENLANITDAGFTAFIKAIQLQQDFPSLTAISISNYHKLTSRSVRYLKRLLLPKLEELTLRGFADLQNSDLNPLVDEKKLKKFDIQDCLALTESILEKLTISTISLETINLSGCSFSKESLARFLPFCTNLKEVKLTECQVDDELIDAVLQKNPQLHHLNVKNCPQITIRSVERFFQQRKNSLVLDIQGCETISTPDLLNWLKTEGTNLSKFAQLNIGGIVDNTILDFLKDCAKLPRKLSFRETKNKLNLNSLIELAQKIKILDIRGCDLSSTEIYKIKESNPRLILIHSGGKRNNEISDKDKNRQIKKLRIGS